MKVSFDFKENKLSPPFRLLQVLPSPRRKSQSISHKEKIIRDLKEAIEELHLVQSGKLKAKNARDLFNEL